MGVKVQYNPSTGKVSYNPATGKVQVIDTTSTDPCSTCGGDDTDTVAVTITNLSMCCAPTDINYPAAPLLISTRIEPTSTVEAYLNNTWNLSKISSCIWFRQDDVTAHDFTAEGYFGDVCGGASIQSLQVLAFRHGYRISFDGLNDIAKYTLEVAVNTGTIPGPIFAWNTVNEWEGIITGSDCFPTLTETGPCGYQTPPNVLGPLGEGGSVTAVAV